MENKEDLKKYFNQEEYITKIIGTGDESDMSEILEEKISTLVSLLTDPENVELKEAALITLKKENGGNLLLAAIANPLVKHKKSILVAACWESEIDFSNHIPFFINLVLDPDYLVSLEAITVIENMTGPFNSTDLKEGIKKVKEYQKGITTEKAVLLNDLVIKLESYNSKL